MTTQKKTNNASFIVKNNGWTVLFATIKKETSKAVLLSIKDSIGLCMWLPKQLLKLSKKNNIYFNIPPNFVIEFIQENEQGEKINQVKKPLEDCLKSDLIADIVTYEQQETPTQNNQ